jgi:hypothetical protein
MNKDLPHLPLNRHDHPQRVVDTVRKHYPAVGITILNGSNGALEYTNIDTYYDKRDKFNEAAVHYLTKREDVLFN